MFTFQINVHMPRKVHLQFLKYSLGFINVHGSEKKKDHKNVHMSKKKYVDEKMYTRVQKKCSYKKNVHGLQKSVRGCIKVHSKSLL